MEAPQAPRFFASPEAFGAWLERNHAKARELLVGYWKVGTGKPSMTWPQSVEQALRFGWIDGVRRSLGAESYAIRFTPRRPGSPWSRVNVATAHRLVAEGRMAPAGLRAFGARSKDWKPRASYEQAKAPRFGAAHLRAFKANPEAWAYFSKRAPGYRRLATWWVVSAKREETKERRLSILITASAKGKDVGDWKAPPGKAARTRKP